MLNRVESHPTHPAQEDEAPATTTAEPEGADAVASRAVHPLVAILLAGAVLRLVLWAWFQDKPIHIWDEQDYNTLAVNLLRSGEFAFTPGTPTSLRPPLYPALVAGVYRLFGPENFQAVRLLQ